MTKTLITTAAILLATSVQAADSRQQFVSGNPDSDNVGQVYRGIAAAPASTGSKLDRYHGIAHRNPDLFGAVLGSSPEHTRPDIYGPFGASPDLSY
jgi:hypothetical protein